MKTELRIGNYLMSKGGESPAKVVAIADKYVSFNTFLGQMNVPYEDVEAIPLTGEMLEKCGFENVANLFELNKMAIYMPGGNYKNGRLYYNSWFIIEPPLYLHQLQNIYYALTGEELEINL